MVHPRRRRRNSPTKREVMTVEVRLTLEGVDLDRFRAWMQETAQWIEKGIEEPEYKRSPIESTIIYGFRLQKYVCIYKFWEVTPTEREIEFARLMAKGDNPELRKRRGLPPLSPEKQEQSKDAAARWEATTDAYIRALVQRNDVLWSNGSEWLYVPKNEWGQYIDIEPLAWIEAREFTVGRLRVTFWRDDRQPGYDALLDALKSDFAGTWQEDAGAGFPGKTSAPASAEIPQIDAGATAENPQSDDQAGAPAVDEETERRLQAVREWPKAKREGIKRRDYVHPLGISESGLTRWRDELRNRGFDVPDF
jgi:hypothetical protein